MRITKRVMRNALLPEIARCIRAEDKCAAQDDDELPGDSAARHDVECGDDAGKHEQTAQDGTDCFKGAFHSGVSF